MTWLTKTITISYKVQDDEFVESFNEFIDNVASMVNHTPYDVDVRDPTMRTSVPVTEVDNRDNRTTWLWINESQYVEIDPVDLVENMIDNCAEWYKESGVEREDLDDALNVLKSA